jgi:hypothetical protein
MSDLLHEEDRRPLLLSDAEHQLVEMLREQHMEPDGFRLVIERVNEGWEAINERSHWRYSPQPKSRWGDIRASFGRDVSDDGL